MNYQKLILIRGIPGAGKSTLAKLLIDSGVVDVLFEADDHFISASGQYIYNPSQIREAHIQCQLNTKQALKQGKSVVVANTFIRKWELKPYFELAAQTGITPTIITANGDYKSIHDVPQSKVNHMKANFEN